MEEANGGSIPVSNHPLLTTLPNAFPMHGRQHIAAKTEAQNLEQELKLTCFLTVSLHQITTSINSPRNKFYVIGFFQLLRNFLLHLPKPVCLVAHFGLGFDFPLLRSELENIGFDFRPEADELGLAEDLLVVDSLEAFKQIFAEKAKEDAVIFYLIFWMLLKRLKCSLKCSCNLYSRYQFT